MIKLSLFLVGLGGIFGGLSRFWLGRKISQKSRSNFPIGTFVINITGATFLGLLCGINIKGNIYLFFGDGFFGAFTTFSTFMYEGFSLIQQSEKKSALIYILGTLFLGMIGFVLGFMLGNKL